jgi:hypothetical protein
MRWFRAGHENGGGGHEKAMKMEEAAMKMGEEFIEKKKGNLGV